MLERFDELRGEMEANRVFFEYHEPRMAPDFFPTYKKIAFRGKVRGARDGSVCLCLFLCMCVRVCCVRACSEFRVAGGHDRPRVGASRVHH
jgi:hypothetical protein